MARPKHTQVAAGRARQLRYDTTISETRLWQFLRRKQLGVRFRRQVPIGSWIVDFACLEPKIVIEVDDRSHHWRNEEARDAHLRSEGFVVLRVTNKEVTDAPDETVDWLQRCVDWIRR